VLAKAGANVWLAGRDVEKTRRVADAVAAECGDPSRVNVLPLDLSSLSSVRAAIAQFTSLGVPLHILLNNAGCMAVQQRTTTADGFEMQFGTNHLGHFVLTNGLIDCLKAGAPSRIVNVSSMAHMRAGVNFDDPQLVKAYDPVHSRSCFPNPNRNNSNTNCAAVESIRSIQDRQHSSCRRA
jgi:NAD(P)-dependent dehydrogenase (short-subunit alcohol dehydrogenase family)